MSLAPNIVAIQGELGSNSHLAAQELYPQSRVLSCGRAADVVQRLGSGEADAAVLPFENTLHGSVAEHYDLLLEEPVRLVAESLLRVRHSVIVAPGVRLGELHRVLSHPVALSQCRGWLRAHPAITAEAFYDTAGSVKNIMAENLRDTAGIAPGLAAAIFGAEVIAAGIEDNEQNYTRFHTLVPAGATAPEEADAGGSPNKLSVAFTLEHRPGSLVEALSRLAATGADLTRIESRPVHGSPWEYTFLLDLRCGTPEGADRALEVLGPVSTRLRELGRYRAATLPQT